MTVGAIFNDGRMPRPWVYVIRSNDVATHQRFHDKKAAERDRERVTGCEPSTQTTD